MCPRRHSILLLRMVCSAASLLTACSILSSCDRHRPKAVLPAGGTYDFGALSEGEELTHGFALQNAGTGVLKIEKVRSGCGCLQAAAASVDVPPHGSTTIRIKYQARLVKGRDSVQAFVQTNDPSNQILTLTLTGAVRYRVFWFPRVVSFYDQAGTVVKEQCVSFFSGIANCTLSLELVSVSNDHLVATIGDGPDGPTLQIAVSPGCPRGSHSGVIRVVCRGSQWTKVIDVPVIAVLR